MLGALLAAGAASVRAEGEAAPDYAADFLVGEGSLSLSSLRGSVVMVNTWATWCEPCREEMPYLEELHRRYSGQGLRVVGVSVDQGGSDARLQEFVAEMGVTFTILRDKKNTVARAFRTLGVPETFLIDRNGVIVHRWRGALAENNPDDRALIEQTLAGVIDGGPEPASRISTVAIPVAFVAGLLSFLSPCVFPLVPTYATVVSGISFTELRSPSPAARARVRRTTLSNGLCFVAGFSLVFIALGASATALGQLLYDHRIWISRLGAVFLALLGLHLLGVLRLPWADRDFRHRFDHRPAGYGGTLLIGIAFGAGWTPCIGPTLASILTLTAASASIGEGMGLLAAYSLGLAIPFLAATVMLDSVTSNSPRIRPWLPRLERVSGVLILLVAALLFTDALSRLAELGTWSPL